MRTLRAAWVAATVAAGAAAACVEQTTAPGKCPDFCPAGSIVVVDTILGTSIGRDSAFRGYVFANQAVTMIATNAPGSMDSRPIFVTTTLPRGLVLNAGDTTTSPLVAPDSFLLTLTITRRDTAAHDLTLRLYRLPATMDSTTTFAAVQGAFANPPQRTVNLDSLLSKPKRGADSAHVDTTTGDRATLDTLAKHVSVTVKFDSLQAPYAPSDSGKLGLGIQVAAARPASVSFATREDPTLGGAAGAWWMRVDSIKGKDTTRIHRTVPLAVRAGFDSYVFAPPIAPLDSTLVVGGAPSARSILRITLPRAIRDSAQIIRGTLVLVPAVAPLGAPGDSFVVEAHTVLADFGAKSPLALDVTRTDTTFIRVGQTDTVRIEVTNLLQFWVGDSTRPTVVMLRSQEEGGHPSDVRFYPSTAAAYRPALRITYGRRFPFGKR
jgi:hypothetical protein